MIFKIYFQCKQSLYPLCELSLTLAVTRLLTTQTRDVTKHPSVNPSALDFAKTNATNASRPLQYARLQLEDLQED